jgi:nucleoside-triphosphatase THEP1
MLNIKHEPTKDFHSNYVVEVDSVDNAIKELIPRIRKQSQDFYTKNIREELERKGNTIIDQHAGNGSFYSVILVK